MTTATTLPQTGTWNIDPTHSEIGFVARHLMVTKVRGGFESFSGSIDVADPIEKSTVDVSIETGSFDSGTEDRDAHVKGPDFLDTENFPAITFTSTAIRPSGSTWEMDGDLTIKGVTKPVTLDVEFDGTATDPWGGTRAAFTATTKINREDWGLTWNVPLEGGGVLVSKEIQINLEVQAVKA